VRTVKNGAEAGLVASEEVSADVNAEETVWSCLVQRVQDNHSIRSAETWCHSLMMAR
jgi:hypothetical protein